jgi:RimJ/RimL family protein N-acetyltransferase
MNPPLSRRGLPVRLRPAGPQDTERLFEWQNAPGARQFSSNPNPPTRQEHLAWMAQKLDEPRCIFNVITQDDIPAGVLRLDQRQDGSFMVSILVADAARKGGIASAALNAGARLMRGTGLWAKIDQRNTASLHAFRNAGFLPQGEGVYHRAHTP